MRADRYDELLELRPLNVRMALPGSRCAMISGRDIAAEAGESGKLVLLNFGANWCPDCRAFARATADPELAAIIADRFVTAKIDVGNWDRNPDVVDEWDNPIGEGIPALVVASPDGERLFATQRGQVSSASRMSRDDLAEFFRLLAEVADSAQVADAGR